MGTVRQNVLRRACLTLGSFFFSAQDDEDAEEVQEQLRREWGTVSVQDDQNEYDVDTAELQSKVRGPSLDDGFRPLTASLARVDFASGTHMP